MPRWLQVDFSPVVQKEAEVTEAEVSGEQIADLFQRTYLQPYASMRMKSYQVNRQEGQDSMDAVIIDGDTETSIHGEGRGVLEAFTSALSKHIGKDLVIIEYNEHTLGQDDASDAIAYVQLSINSQRVCGAGRSQDILGATLRAILNAVARV